MKYDEIIKLLDAGYTRDEILNMQDAHTDGKQDDPADGKQDDPADGNQDAPVSMDVIMSEVKDMFAEMKKELTAMNILNSRQRAESERTSEDILASIINPTIKSGGK